MREILNRLFEQDEHEMATGRPRIWKTPEDMQHDITDYFTQCINNTATKYNDMGLSYEVDSPLIPTLEGLAMMLGIDRKTLYNYSKEEGYEAFFPTIKKAKDYILSYKTNCLINGGGCLPGLIFDLKNNHGFVEKVETDVTSGGAPVQHVKHEIQIVLND